jgi:hypothetical protein
MKVSETKNSCSCSAHNKSTKKASKPKGKKPKKKLKKGEALDTLAQLGTKVRLKPKNALLSNSDSADILDDVKLTATSKNNQAALFKRATRVYLKNALSLGLVDINKARRAMLMENVSDVSQMLEYEKEDKDVLRSYWNMYHCAGELTKIGDKITGRYCKNRLCLVCNSIRTAVLIEKYKPVFDEWGDDTYFVTLTAKTVDSCDLDDRIDGMFKVFNKIKERLRKRAQRTDTEKFQGLRKIECTYNPHYKKYHPHFHLMIKGEKHAKQVLNYWLELGKKEGWEMSRDGQDVRQASKGSEMELFKYFTKIISSKAKDKSIYLDSLDVIFKAFRGRRVFQNFGFKLPKIEKEEIQAVEELQSPEVENFNEIIAFLENYGSEHVSTGVLISEMKGKKGLKELIEWVKTEKQSGLPFMEIKTVVELLEQMIDDIQNVAPDDEGEVYKWDQDQGDWISQETGEFLSGHKIGDALKEVVSRMKIPSIYRRFIIDDWLTNR